MLGEKVSRYGMSAMGSGYKPGDQMGLHHTNKGIRGKAFVPAKKDIAENEQLGRFEPVHVHRNKNVKKSHLEK